MNKDLKKILILSILLLGLIYPNNFCTNGNINHNLSGIIGVMVDFQEEFPDDDLRTSGDGKFLDSNDALPHFINYEDLPRCSKTLLDPPPHGIEYFNSQLKAVTNYYRNISNDDIFLDYIMIILKL